MTLRHAIVSLVAIMGLAACSDDDTIVSLNVTAAGTLPVIDNLRVTVTQGSHEYVANFAPPIENQDTATPSIKNSFFQRITLPGEWSEADATVGVQALQASGAPYTPNYVDQTVAVIQPEGVVAAYVKLDVPPEPPPSDGGAGGAGGDSGTGGTATGGTATGGTGGTATGGTDGGGAGGAGGASNGGAGGGENAGAGG
jgi:hypothetical protein